ARSPRYDPRRWSGRSARHRSARSGAAARRSRPGPRRASRAPRWRRARPRATARAGARRSTPGSSPVAGSVRSRSVLAGVLDRNHRHVELLAGAFDLEPQLVADPDPVQRFLDRVRDLAVHLADPVADLDARAPGRALIVDPRDHQSALLVEPELA